jgi:preprotein translocase subunit SecY
MEETPKPRSKLYALEPLLRYMPEVAVPKRHVPFKEKFIWTTVALALFFVMAQIPLYGIPEGQEVGELLGQLRFIFASQTGTLMELGIGPIVTAGIIMQLLVGSKIINLDLRDPQDRAIFTSSQKLLAILVAVFEASMLVLSGRYGVGLETGPGLFILFQLSLGAIIVIFLDEVVSKYGFGSGVSLFIAGGVAMTVFWLALNPSSGVIPVFLADMGRGEDFITAFFAGGQSTMMGLLATIIIFFVVVYTQTLRIEIPITYPRYGGIRARYPIRFLYTSNIPVILAMTVFANFRIASALFNLPWLTYYTTPPNGLASVAADPLRTVVYVVLLVALAVGFGWMWIYMTNMSPRDIARQLDEAGMMIPGHRKDIRVMEEVLGRYIIPTTILGSAFVGLISAGADMLGALGSGTGILLTVGIVYSLYEQIAREQVSEMFPAVRRLIGE